MIELRGLALHAGCETAATLARRAGPIALARAGREVPLGELSVARADRGVALAGGGLEVDLVEHLAAALGALGIRRDLLVTVDGPELPLLDGGAARWFDALATLDLSPSPPSLVVAERATLRAGESTYRFEPADAVEIEVDVSFAHPMAGDRRAAWSGDARDFRERIAPCRTFGFAREAEALARAGRARGVDRNAVLVLTDDGVLDGCAPPRPGELAGHKLLDLVGDLALHGGPPRGRIVAERPGHAATHAAVRAALAQGILARAT